MIAYRGALTNASQSPRPQPIYKVPYILPSSVYSNSFVFKLFTKLPGWGGILPKSEQKQTPDGFETKQGMSSPLRKASESRKQKAESRKEVDSRQFAVDSLKSEKGLA